VIIVYVYNVSFADLCVSRTLCVYAPAFIAVYLGI